MKHFYQTIPSPQEMVYCDFYREMVNKYPSGSHFVEVGVYYGRSFSFLVTEVVNSGKKIRCSAVDACPWPDVEPGFRFHMKPLDGHFDTYFEHVDSFVAAQNFPDNSLDLVWIDANHTYPFVIQDIKAYLPKMKKGGTLSGHDWSDPGVRQAVREVFKDFIVDEKQDLWRVQL